MGNGDTGKGWGGVGVRKRLWVMGALNEVATAASRAA